MIIVSIVVFIILAILMMLGKNCNKELISKLNKKEEPLRIFYPAIEYCHQLISKLHFCKNKCERKQLFQEIYIREAAKMQLLHFYRKVSLVTMITILTLMFAAVMELVEKADSNNQVKQEIRRPKAGEGDNSFKVEFKTSEGMQGNLEIEVSERKLNKEEVSLLFEECKKYIDKNILGDNASINEVKSRLNLMKTIPGSSVSIKWSVSDTSYMNSYGEIFNEKLQESKLILIEAEIKYYEYEIIYSQYANILPKEYSEEEQLIDSIKGEIADLNKLSQSEKSLKLPEKINNTRLIWNFPKKKTGIQLLFLGVSACVGVIIGTEASLQSKKKKRNIQLLIDYPEIVCKFTLLLNAGMTIRGAFERITHDYCNRRIREVNSKKQAKKEIRYAYEEILLAVRELNIGKAERLVYDALGKRFSLLCYLRFSTIIIQNMKKGTKGIVHMLEMEALDAFRERKECAKRLGEEASTKLLVPMIGMLLIVLLIVLVPAFLKFSI